MHLILKLNDFDTFKFIAKNTKADLRLVLSIDSESRNIPHHSIFSYLLETKNTELIKFLLEDPLVSVKIIDESAFLHFV